VGMASLEASFEACGTCLIADAVDASQCGCCQVQTRRGRETLQCRAFPRLRQAITDGACRYLWRLCLSVNRDINAAMTAQHPHYHLLPPQKLRLHSPPCAPSRPG